MGEFKKLEVWKRAHSLALALYRVTGRFPKAELYGLTSQLRRAGVSVAANLAEGSGRRGDGEFGRFVRIACGSAKEVEYLLLISRDLGFIGADTYVHLAEEADHVSRMLVQLDRFLQRGKRRASGV